MKPKKSKFNLSHQRKLTAPFGKLIPCYVQEVLPGDTIRCHSEIMTKMFPMMAPIYHHVDVYTEYFFVPNRLLWQATKDAKAPLNGPANAWEGFMTGSFDTSQATADWLGRKVPTVAIDDATNVDGSLWDFFGIPQAPKNSSGTSYLKNLLVSQLPFRAYHKIYYDWYINEWLQADEVQKSDATFKGDVFDPSWSRLQYRNWQHGYFTDALPSTQKGSVNIPISGAGAGSVHKHTLGDEARHVHFIHTPGVPPNNLNHIHSIISSGEGHKHPTWDDQYDGAHDHAVTTAPGTTTRWMPSNTAMTGLGAEWINTITTQPEWDSTVNTTGNIDGYSPTGSVKGKTEDWTPDSLGAVAGYLNPNDLRYGMQLQKFLERNARAGNRYTEFLKSHFGAHNKDSRLQRSEFLGGGRSPIVVSEVLQTSETNETTDKPLGGYAGHGVGASGRHGFHKRHFTEHGWIIGLMSIVPKQEYGGQGLPRQFTHLYPTDFAFPEFAHLGEQEIYKYELVVKDQENIEKEVFGYAPRYEEYRHGEVQGGICSSMRYVTGDTKHVGGLDFWHMNRKFVSWDATNQTEVPVVPVLNKRFIATGYYDTSGSTVVDRPDITHRIFPVVDNDPYKEGDVLFAHIINHVHARRCLPKVGRPGMLDHF